MTISGRTQLYAVIGDPIEHTLSPLMHNAAFKELNIDAVFLAFKVVLSQVEHALQGMRGLGIKGLNVTMPDKNAVIHYLDEVDETAKLLGSVNTILNENGKLRGFSTDGTGAHHALEESGINVRGKKIVLLGAGGAARAIAFALAREAEELVILNRTIQKANELAQAINTNFHKRVVAASLRSYNVKESLINADILINATSVGMTPTDERSPIESSYLGPKLTVMDIIYNPLETKLVQDAKAKGAKVITGLDMLIYQGAASFEIWTGKGAPIEVMKQAVLEQIKRVGKNS